MEKYIKENKIYTRKSQDNKDLIVFKTDFEEMEIIFNKNKVYPESSNLLRFISDDFAEYYKLDNSEAVYYLPDHISEKITCIIEKSQDDECQVIDEVLNQYLPIKMQVDSSKLNKPNIVYDHIVPNKLKGDIGTSLFKSCNSSDIEDIKNIASQLRKNIADVRDDLFLLGTLPRDYGIIEQSYKTKNTDPESRHCHFWKLQEDITNNSYWDMGKLFEVIS